MLSVLSQKQDAMEEHMPTACIAMSFATWISPEFQLYIMKDYRRLKTDKNSRLSLNWNLNREISKLNYRIHTDAIKGNLIPPELTSAQVAYTYVNEADMLSVVLFGKTAKQWKDENPTSKGKSAGCSSSESITGICPTQEQVCHERLPKGKAWERYTHENHRPS